MARGVEDRNHSSDRGQARVPPRLRAASAVCRLGCVPPRPLTQTAVCATKTAVCRIGCVPPLRPRVPRRRPCAASAACRARPCAAPRLFAVHGGRVPPHGGLSMLRDLRKKIENCRCRRCRCCCCRLWSFGPNAMAKRLCPICRRHRPRTLHECTRCHLKGGAGCKGERGYCIRWTPKGECICRTCARWKFARAMVGRHPVLQLVLFEGW